MQLYDMNRKEPLKIEEWETESALDRFLFENPEALSQALYPEEDNRLLPLGRQIQAVDILYLRLPTSENPEPGLLICEDKLAANPELRRKVLGQVIDYAATLSTMTDEQFQALMKDNLAKPDVRAVQQRCLTSGVLNAEDLADALTNAEAARSTASIECVICASTIPDQMLQMVKWVNAATQGRADKAIINACTAEKWHGNDITIVAVASALTMIRQSDLSNLSETATKDLIETATALARLPAFHVHLAQVAKTQHAAIVEDLVPPSPAQRSRSSPATVAASVGDWVTKVPCDAIRELYEALDQGITTEKIWRPGGSTGSQLVLEFPIHGAPRPLHVLRLKQSGLSFVPFGFLERNGLEEIAAWARESIAKLGAKDPNARQPSLTSQELLEKPRFNKSIVGFVKELSGKVLKAVTAA